MNEYFFNGVKVRNYSEPKGKHSFRDGKYWVKVFPDEKSFTHELTILETLSDCSGVVSVTDTGSVKIVSEDGGTCCLPAIKELYVSERNISQYCMKHYNEDEIRKLVLRLVKTLMELEERGILHNDIKPDNILVTDDGHPILIDFNISKKIDEPVKDVHTKKTESYVAPEKEGKGIVSILTEIYSLGCIIKKCMTQRSPEYKDHYSQGFIAIANKCTEIDPCARYQSFGDMEKDLLQLSTVKSQEVDVASPVERKWSIRKVIMKYSSVLTVLFYACGLIFTLMAFFMVIASPDVEAGYVPDLKADLNVLFDTIKNIKQ